MTAAQRFSSRVTASVFCIVHTNYPVFLQSGCFALIKLLSFTQFVFFHSFSNLFSSLVVLPVCLFIHSGSCLSLSAFRFVPEVVPSGPAGGQFVPQLLVSREDNEVLQLHPSQQSPPAPDIHARHVVRRSNGATKARVCLRRAGRAEEGQQAKTWAAFVTDSATVFSSLC